MKNGIYKWFRKISITKKIFLLMMVSITIFVALCILTQVFFYSRAYHYRKTKHLNDTIESFQLDYEQLNWYDQIRSSITRHSDEGDSYIMVLDENGNIIYSVSYEMCVKSEAGEEVRLSLDGLIRDKSFYDMKLEAGSTVTVDYMYIKEGRDTLYLPEKISAESGVWQIERREIVRPDRSRQGYGLPEQVFLREHFEKIEMEIKTISGTVESITIPTSNSMSSVQRADANRAVGEWMRRLYNGEKVHNGKILNYAYENAEDGYRYEVGVKGLSNGQMIFAITTLAPVEEAVRVMWSLSIPWLLGTVILAMAVAFALSRMVTKSVVNISHVTSKMKDLDFSQKCEITSEDELGILAMNVNEMSDKLSDTINRLMDANSKLTDDIRREREFERQRQEFVAAVSHELKTPLAIIRAYAEGLIDGVSAKKQERYMSIIVSETKKMDRLVLDMLENAKLESGAEKLNQKEHDLARLAGELTRVLTRNAAEKQMTVTFEADPPQIRAVFDGDKMEQVITNFISNAIRHGRREGSIAVRLKRTETEAVFSVENTGSHIDEAELPKIWDRFYKGDRSRGGSSGGTGLGLSIARNILRLHGARYGVQNTADGVKFWFSLKI